MKHFCFYYPQLHNYLGLATYVCGLGACVSGFTKETGGGLLGTAAGSLSYIVGLAGVWVYLYQPKVAGGSVLAHDTHLLGRRHL